MVPEAKLSDQISKSTEAEKASHILSVKIPKVRESKAFGKIPN